MSRPFRERNPVVIGAVSLAVVAGLLLAAFRAQDLPLIGGGDTYYAAFAESLDRNRGEIDRALQVLPIKLTKIGRTATYGSFFNFYLCNFEGRVKLPGGRVVPLAEYNTGGARCSLG
jgi:ABC-type transporter Mla subunit MlaD